MDKEFLNACETGNLDEVLQILYYHDDGEIKLLQQDPNSLDHMHYFHVLCFHGHHEIVEQLFVFEVDVNLNSQYGTPLSVACQGGHLKTVEVLIKHGATIFDPNAVETLSPIFQACKHGHRDVFIYLISEKPDIISALGARLLVQACHDGHLDIVLLLVSKDIDVNGASVADSPTNACISYESMLESPLRAACSQQHVEVVEYLLQEGAEVTLDLVEHYYEVLGEAVSRNFKECYGRHQKEKEHESMEADFCAANFYAIHDSWFTHCSKQLVSVDLSNNYLQSIPKEIMNLPFLKEVDVSSNSLFHLPEVDDVHSSRLEVITASSNGLTHVPLSFFNLQSLLHLNLANNAITSLLNVEDGECCSLEEEDAHDDVVWQCYSLKSLNLANNELTSIPMAIHAANSLEKLQLCENKLTSFPRGWKCPLRILNLAKNELMEFQESAFNTWSKTMDDLNLSSNKLTTISWDICQLQTLQKLDLSKNCIESMPPKSHWTCTNLRRLNLANNKLRGIHYSVEVSSPVRPKRFSLARSPSSEERVCIEDEFPYEVFGETLEYLDLSNNELCAIPSSLCQFKSLEELNLSRNRSLKTLPPELGNLTECYQLGLNGLNLNSCIPKYAKSGGSVTSKDILTYLRAKQRKSVPYNRMKLMAIGLQGRGKTTLLAALSNKPQPPNISTVGIVVDEWTISGTQSFLEKMTIFPKKESLPKTNPKITFSTWDLAGQHIYYSTHQCFLSSNTLYLAVWNTSHGDEGIDKLKPWLLNVQARAPGSHVIIVGTHADLLPQKTKAKRSDELRLKISKRYNKKGYPIIKGNYVVSCTNGENIPELREAIYKAALELKESENAGKGESLIGRKIPLSYLKLQANVVKEAETRKKENKPPILNEEQMLELAKQDPNNDIYGRDELVLAARFLHENGVILHYNDHSRGLDKLYFIEPGWLCEIMALLVTVKETNAFVKGGIIERANVNLLLKNPRLPSKFIEQYIQLMERFEVALTLDEHRLLVPSMLPRDKPGMMNEEKCQSKSSDCLDKHHSREVNKPFEYLKRLYKMNYVPSGFWSRIIARLMIAVQRWGAEEGLGDELICNEGGKAVRSSNMRPVPHGYTMFYWREGMGVFYEGGHLLVESYREKERNINTGMSEHIEGVMVTVCSTGNDFSVLGFVTDQINSLISEWYPGLQECDKYGIPLVRHTIPCPICAKRAKPFPPLRRSISSESVQALDDNKPQEFSLTECAAAAVGHREISCPHHIDEPVKLHSLVPDLLLSDLPDEFLIDSKALIFNPVDENRLGSGGAGEVFLGSYRKKKVAIKRFYSTKESWTEMDSGIGSGLGYLGNRGGSRHTDGGSIGGRRVFISRITNIEEELRRTRILSSFWELRQEVSVLGRLNHPCVVALVGVCVYPLCIVLELSPLGSLYSILETELKKREAARFQKDSQTSINVRKTILERDLTYKIVYQVVHALCYLHGLGIIYRDLKSDNLLVWTLDKDALVHVKLSDYGISRFATPQGTLGEEGTPGFQAPEVRTGSTYNEKVDIFSFAMVIYEVLSGFRPYYECRCSSQIKKAVRRGVRPSLVKECIDSEMPEMDALMEKCWKESIISRPSANSILEQMQDPSFLCLKRVLPYADQKPRTNITALIPLTTEDQVFSDTGSSKGSQSVLLWGGENEERCFSVIDCETGFYQVTETLCLGPRVACLAKVGERYWLGTEASAIEIFGRATPASDLTVLWSIKLKAHVLALEVEQYTNDSSNDRSAWYVGRVFACLANGTIVVISRQEFRKSSSTSCSLQFRADANEKLRQEAGVYSVMTTVDVGDRESPACCLVFVKDGDELWVGCGNHVSIVDVDNLEISHKFRAYIPSRSNVRAMATDGSSVFTINRQTSYVRQWDVQTRELLYKFDFNLEDPRGQIIAQKVVPNNHLSKGGSGVNTEDDFPLPANLENEPEYPVNQSQSPVQNDPDDSQMLPDVPDIQQSRGYPMRQPSLMRSMKRGSSRKLSRKKLIGVEEVVEVPTTQANASNPLKRSRKHDMSNSRKRITSAVVVDGNMWLGRESGDIAVVNISDKDDEEEYGKVLAVLSMADEPDLLKREMHLMTRIARDKIISCARLVRKPSLVNKGQVKTVPATNRPSPFKFLTMRNLGTNTSQEDEPPSEMYQVCIWARWKNEDFKQFFKYHEDLENAS